ncbi:E3 ubiquitin-protein ligase TRIM33-like [Haliotis rubra]|uniref:E3 ubiquitin-protein ligase TRIM33-like n=1 Tax=Haliotis rubra TaxID=36100 RepID=UPI001EE5CE42|nr:E3 ubiquitin-protein ligase TRIM33-like [Haliotis rubra]
MASKARVLHCCVCKKPYKYKGADPYLLPCLHSACAECIGAKGEAITCLFCRESFDKGKFIFLNDAITQAETLVSTLQYKPSEIKCTNKDHTLDAVSWCKECESFFCRSCQAAHSQVKSSSTHRMVSLKDMVAADLQSVKSFCPDHESYALDLYDETCEILICSKCARSDHKHCQSEELDDVVAAVTKETEEDKMKLAAKLQNVKSLIDESNEKQEMMRKRHSTLKDLLTSRFNSLRDLITRREAEVTKALEFRHLSEMDEAGRVSNKLKQMFSICDNTHSYTGKLLELGNKSDMLMLKEPVKFRTEMALSEEAEVFDFVPVHVTFSKENIHALENILQTVCDIETTEGDDGSFLNLYANYEGSPEKDVPGIADDDQKGDARHVKAEREPIDVDPDNDNGNKEVGNEENEQGTGAELIDDTGPLSYPALKFDMERININKVHVNNKGFLVNTTVSPERKLRKYVGTTAGTPLPKNKFSYWEVQSDFDMASKMHQRGLLMEIGVATGASLDNNYCMSGQVGSRCLAIAHCSAHDGVCAKVWSNGQKLRCYENVLSTGSGTSETLRHGLLYDGTRNILTVFDLNNVVQLVALGEGELDDDQWPVFGAYNSSLASVQMKLVSGSEIEMFNSKTKMLKGALNSVL